MEARCGSGGAGGGKTLANRSVGESPLGPTRRSSYGDEPAMPNPTIGGSDAWGEGQGSSYTVLGVRQLANGAAVLVKAH